MMGGTRTPTWKERENNKRRERRRRAFAAKIFCGLRLYGNYTLPKHCDNNEVLKALCNEAGWTVHPDGTTYRKGCKPVDNMDFMGRSTSASPCTSYNPSPPSSSIPSPISPADGNSLIPWLRNLSSSSSSSSKHMHHYMHIGGSMSAPVTPPLSSPTAQTPQIFDSSFDFLPLSTPPSPSRVRIPRSGPTSPTLSLVSLNPFGFGLTRSGSLMGQSGTCSPCVDIPMGEMIPSNEFAFGSNNINNNNGLVKAWEGERIHEEYCGSDELELTLGTSKTR